MSEPQTVERRIGKMLRDMRQRKGLKQTEIASRLGIHQSLVTRLEQGSRRVGVVEFLQLAEVMGIKPHAAIDMVLEQCGSFAVVEVKNTINHRPRPRAAARRASGAARR